MNLSLQLAIQKTRLVLSKHGDHDQSDHGNWAEGVSKGEGGSGGRSKLWAVATQASIREHKLEDEYKNLSAAGKKAGIASDHPKLVQARNEWQNARWERKSIETRARKEDRATGLTHVRDKK